MEVRDQQRQSASHLVLNLSQDMFRFINIKQNPIRTYESVFYQLEDASVMTIVPVFTVNRTVMLNDFNTSNLPIESNTRFLIQCLVCLEVYLLVG